jgi:hypothetical protein|tara:strand:- start:285 stop:491 length:207 start_codon:yes stop_codon:yes gene_type:complete
LNIISNSEIETLTKEGSYQVEILNQIGAVIFSGENQSDFNYGASLAPGVYSVVISNQLERKLLRVLKF